MQISFKKLLSLSFLFFMSSQGSERQSLIYKLSSSSFIKCNKCPEECQKFFKEEQAKAQIIAQLGCKVSQNTASKQDLVQLMKAANKDADAQAIDTLATNISALGSKGCSLKSLAASFTIESPTTAKTNLDVEVIAPDFSGEAAMVYEMLIKYFTSNGSIPPFLDEKATKALKETFDKFQDMKYELQHCIFSMTKAAQATKESEPKK